MALTKIPNNLITADAIDGTLIADDAINSEHIANGAIDAAHMSVNSIDSDSYVDGSIDNAHLADDAVGVAELSATGTASSSTFLRGDNSWTAVSTPITALNNATANELVTVGSTTTELDAESGLTYNGSALTVTGTITCDGLTTGNNEDVSIGGILKGSDSTFQILTSTSDGSDSSRIRICGGGSTGSSRGAQLELQGNEHTFVGEAQLASGDVSGAFVGISAPHSGGYITLGTGGSERMRIDSSGNLNVLTGTISEDNIPTRSRAIAMAMVFG